MLLAYLGKEGLVPTRRTRLHVGSPQVLYIKLNMRFLLPSTLLLTSFDLIL